MIHSAQTSAPAPRGRLAATALPLLPLGLTLLVYHSIIENYFFGDDLYNLYQIANGDLLTYLVTPYGDHLLVTRNFLFYLCHRFFGTEPQGYFWVVLATHLVNVALFFHVIRGFTGSLLLATFGASLWGAAPLHEGTLGWYSVFGNVVVASCMLWLLADLARILHGQGLGASTLGRWVVLSLVAITSFGVGIAIVLVLPLVVVLILPVGPQRRALLLCTAVVAVTTPPLYFAVMRSTVPVGDPALVTSFLSFATVTIWDRLVSMVAMLAGYGVTSLLVGELYSRKGFGGALAYAAIAFYLVVVIGGLLRGSRQTRRVILGSVLLSTAAYGIVAAGRGMLWGDQFYLATRYQYVGLIPATLALCLGLGELDRSMLLSFSMKQALLVAWATAAVGAHLWLGREIDHHRPQRNATRFALDEMRRLIDAAPAGHDVYITNRVFAGVGPLMIRNPQLFPGWAAAFAIFFPDNVVDGRRVFFVVPDAEVRAAARNGKRTSTLVVAPEEVRQ